MDWLTILPPVVAIIVAVWTKNVYLALGLKDRKFYRVVEVWGT